MAVITLHRRPRGTVAAREPSPPARREINAAGERGAGSRSPKPADLPSVPSTGDSRHQVDPDRPGTQMRDLIATPKLEHSPPPTYSSPAPKVAKLIRGRNSGTIQGGSPSPLPKVDRNQRPAKRPSIKSPPHQARGVVKPRCRSRKLAGPLPRQPLSTPVTRWARTRRRHIKELVRAEGRLPSRRRHRSYQAASSLPRRTRPRSQVVRT